jgi:excisionase family DNA binding protein
MPDKEVDRGPIAPSAVELPELRRLHRLVEEQHGCRLGIVAASGETIELPVSALRALRQAVDALAHDAVIVVRRMTKDLLPDEAAEVLNVPPDFVVRLQDEGVLPAHVKEGLRRVGFDDVIEYKRQRDARRMSILSDMAQESQELAALIK